MTNNINQLGVYNSNNYTVTTSKQIAINFEKQHKNILQSIDKLKQDIPQFDTMFFEAELPDAYNRPSRVYIITRDGFTLLAMGFTGKKAMQFKIAYINEFNRMEELVKNTQPQKYSFEIEDAEERAKVYIQEVQVFKQEIATRDSKIEEQQEYINQANSYIEYAEPKVETYNRIMETDYTYAVTIIAGDYGMSAKRFNSLLHELRIQYTVNRTWTLYSKYQDNDYTRNEVTRDGFTGVTKWTEKGREFLYNTLKENNILPVSERDPSLLKFQKKNQQERLQERQAQDNQ